MRSIASWKILIARASAPISSARPVCGTSTPSAPSATCLMVAVMTESGRAIERAMISTPSTTTTSARTPRQVRTKAIVWLVSVCCASLLAAFGIDLGQGFQILVQRRPHFAVGVVVAPFAARSGIDLDTAANELLAEIDELLDALLEGGKLLGVVSLDQRLPVLDDVKNAFVELEQAVAVFFHDRRIGRHVDAARFHHDGIDQRIDALDVERGAAGGRDRFGELGVLAGVVVGQGGDGGDEQREQREDRIQLGCKRKPGCHGATKNEYGI